MHMQMLKCGLYSIEYMLDIYTEHELHTTKHGLHIAE